VFHTSFLFITTAFRPIIDEIGKIANGRGS